MKNHIANGPFHSTPPSCALLTWCALAFLCTNTPSRVSADFTTFGGPTLKWAAQPVQYRDIATYIDYTLNASPTNTSLLPQKTDYLAYNSPYLLRLSLVEATTGIQCEQCAKEYSFVGGFPEVHLGTDDSVETAIPITSWKDDIPLGVTEWYVPFNTTTTSFIYVYVGVNSFSTQRISESNLEDEVFILPVSWAATQNSTGSESYIFGSILSSPASSPPPNAQRFVPSFAPGVSTGWFGFYDTQINLPMGSASSSVNNSVLFTQTFWRDQNETNAMTIGGPAMDAVLTADRCEDVTNSISPKMILNAGVLRKCIVVHARGGVVVGCLNTTSTTDEYTYRNQLPYCIREIQLPSQAPSLNQSGCIGTFAIGKKSDSGNTASEGRIWLMKLSSTSFTELLDSNSRRLAPALNSSYTSSSLTIISATLSPVDCDDISLLVKTNATRPTYSIVGYSLSKQTWSKNFEFPKSVPNVCPDGINPTLVYNGIDINYSGTPEVRNIDLSGMKFHRSLSRDTFIWGSALFFTSNNALSVHLIRTFPGTTNITTFVSATDGGYAFMTTDNQIFYGQVGISKTVPITNPLTPLSRILGLEFDGEDELYLFESVVVNGQTQIRRQLLDLQSMLDFYELRTEASCPYSRVIYDASQDAVYTRNLIISPNDLPSAFFLDYQGQFNFSVTVTPPDLTTDLSRMEVYFWLSNTDAVTVDSVRSEQNGNVRYDVSVSDLGTVSAQNYPGVDASPTQLKVMVKDATYDCLNFARTGTVKSEVVNYADIYSGCPPRLQTVYVPDASTLSGCVDPSPDVPCTFYDNDFTPDFYIKDLVTGEMTIYTGEYQLYVIGGGHYLEDVRKYSDDEVQSYNPGLKSAGKSPIWLAASAGIGYTADKEQPVMTHKTNDISWICAIGSPCYHVYPGRHSHPEYYLQFLMTTLNVSRDTTYCHHTTTFIIRLYGLPLDVANTFTITFASMGSAIVALLFTGYFSRWKKMRAVQLEEDAAEAKVGMSSDAVARMLVRTESPTEIGVEKVEPIKKEGSVNALNRVGIVRSAAFGEGGEDGA